MNLLTSFRELPFGVEMSPVWLKHIYSVLCALTWRPMPAAARSRLCSRVSSVIWKSDLTYEMKHSFFRAAVVSILLYGCTTWTLTKRVKKKLDGNYTRMLRAILNMSWKQHPTKQQLYGHQPPFTKLSKLDEPDMQDTAGEIGTSS